MRLTGSGAQEIVLPSGTLLAMTHPMARLLTEREAAERLGLSVRTLQKWRLLRSGPEFLKLGHAVHYDPEDLERYLESSRRRSTSEPGSRSHDAGIRLAPRRRVLRPGFTGRTRLFELPWSPV